MRARTSHLPVSLCKVSIKMFDNISLAISLPHVVNEGKRVLTKLQWEAKQVHVQTEHTVQHWQQAGLGEKAMRAVCAPSHQHLG